MLETNTILLGCSDSVPVSLRLDKSCRHGLIAGATGTGKTATLRILAEGFSQAGIPVFACDVKGDLSALARPGTAGSKSLERLQANGVSDDQFSFCSFPLRFLDVFGKTGTPLRATICDLGPLFLSRLLNLSEAQSGLLNILFKAADGRGWELIDLSDLKAMIAWAKNNREELSEQYGLISSASASALMRRLTEFENQKAEAFLGMPDFNLEDLFEKRDEQGLITLLECSELMLQPMLYSTVILWLLAALYESLPEAGDLSAPRIAVFIDEAHLLFEDMPSALQSRIVQIIKLIRSKGAAIFFVSQSPSDLPDAVLGQLSNRILHGLQAYTPAERRKVKAAVEGMRENPNLDLNEALMNLKTGEALISLLDADGAPTATGKVYLLPPQSGFEAMSSSEMDAFARKDPKDAAYRQRINPYSAEEKIEEEQNRLEQEKEEQARQQALEKEQIRQEKLREKEEEKAAAAVEKARLKEESRKQQALSTSAKKAGRSAARSIGRSTGKAIARGLMQNSSKTARRAAENVAGNLLSDLFSSFFR